MVYTPKSTHAPHPHTKNAPGTSGAETAQASTGEPISAADARMRLASAAVQRAQVLTTEARRHLDDARASMLESVAQYRQSIGEALASLKRGGDQPGVSSEAILQLARDLNAETQAAVGRVVASLSHGGGEGGGGSEPAGEPIGEASISEESDSLAMAAENAEIERAEREALLAEREAEQAVRNAETEAVREMEQAMRETEQAAREAELAMHVQTEPCGPKG
ncbi:MAG: hypothetical protein ACKVZJ_13985 [Phycisphaerales bacterium]